MVLDIAQGDKNREDHQSVVKHEDLLPTFLKQAETVQLKIYSQFLFAELKRRAQEGSPEGLLSASTHGAEVFYELFEERPYRFEEALKKRTKCAVPMPANPKAREKILKFMEMNTGINLKQSWPFDPDNPVNKALLGHYLEICHERILLEGIPEINPKYKLNTVQKEWMALEPLSKASGKDWFRAIWKKIKSETNNQPQDHTKYKVFGYTNAEIQRTFRKYFEKSLVPK